MLKGLRLRYLKNNFLYFSDNLSQSYNSSLTKNSPNFNLYNSTTNLTLPPIANVGNVQNAQNYFSGGNTPPIYEPRYLYIIDCRPNKKQYEKHRINTALHYTDLIDGTVYLSPVVDNFTLIVLYDQDGSFLQNYRSQSNDDDNDFYEENR